MYLNRKPVILVLLTTRNGNWTEIEIQRYTTDGGRGQKSIRSNTANSYHEFDDIA